MFKFIVKLFRKKSAKTDLMAKKIEESFSRKYKNLHISPNVSIFHTQILNIVIESFEQNGYKEIPQFIKELKYFLHYTLNVLQDDYFIGYQFFKEKLTKIDDYVFSQYRRDPSLKRNIEKLLVLAYSKRFSEDPRENLLQYFVFIEEYGIEIMKILNDFYEIMDKGDSRLLLGEDLKKKYLTERVKRVSNPMDTFQTLMPTKPLFENNEFL